MDLEDDSMLFRSRWPRMLKHLKLRKLSIECSRPLGSAEMLQRELLSLHSGLKSLLLHVPEAHRLLFDFGPSSPTGSPPPAKIAKISEDTRHRLDPSAQKPTFSALFPQLETLTLYIFGPSTFGSHLWSQLPHSLTSLCVDNTAIEDWACLPPNLTRLNSTENQLTGNQLALLPSSLTDIQAYFDTSAINYLLSAEGKQHLPNLDSFPFNRVQGNLDGPFAQIFMAREWPKNTNDLFFQTEQQLGWLLDSVKVFPLPSSLTSIFLCNLPSIKLSQVFLPTTLLSLRVSSVGDWEEVLNSKVALPPLLTDLKLDFDETFTPACFEFLPRGLRALHVNYGCRRYREDSFLLETAAQCLLEFKDADLWRDILEKSQRDPQGLRYSKKNLDAIRAGKHFGLPLTLTKVLLTGSSTDDLTLALPPHVTEANLGISFSVRVNEFFETLPPSATKLTLPEAQDENDCLAWWMRLASMGQGAFGQNLVRLSLVDRRSIHTLPGLFHLLPRTLTELESAAQGSISATHLTGLPESLQTLFLSSTTFTTNRWAYYLPRKLQSAYINSATLQADDIHNLPPTLTCLAVMDFIELETKHITELPPRMSHVEAEISLVGPDSGSDHEHLDWVNILVCRHMLPRDRSITKKEVLELVRQFWKAFESSPDVDPRARINLI